MNENNFEQVEADLEKVFIESEFQVAVNNNNFCSVYQSARPVLIFFKNFFLFPKKWRTIINGLTTICDGICEQKNI